jgi:hypothetical protein
MEMSDRQTKAIEGGSHSLMGSADTTVAQIDATKKQQHGPRIRPAEKCRNCGKDYPHAGGRNNCPAYGTVCRSCGKPNHWAKCCRSNSAIGSRPATTRSSHGRQPSAKSFTRNANQNRRRQQQLVNQMDNRSEQTELSDDDDEYLFAVGNDNGNMKQPRTSVNIQGNVISMMIDSGASVNIIDEASYKAFSSPPKLALARASIFTYGASKPVTVLGTFESEIEVNHRKTAATFYVTKGTSGCLLSYKTASELRLISISINQINDKSFSQPAGSKITIEDLERKFPQLFNGVGKLKDHQVKLFIDESVKPVAQMNRRIPFHLQTAVEKELKQMLADDIIEPVTGPVSWVSPLVIVNKPRQPGKIRICVDNRAANTAILRQRHVMPTLDDLIHQLNGSRVFSKLDLRNAFLQLELEPNSRYITTFSSHIGLFRYKRLNFGLSVSSELFQSTLSQILSPIAGRVINVCDDILVHAPSVHEHDIALEAVAKKLAECGLTLHKEKCLLNQSQISFYGCVFSADGISVHPDRIKFLEQLPAPQSAAETASLLGMFGFAQRHLPDFATAAQPLRRLTKSGVPFKWTAVEQQSFDTLKARLRQNITTSYFCPSLHSTVHCDGSRFGIAATLTQPDSVDGSPRVICHISRKLTDTESRYSQLEIEALAAVWAVERLHRYIFGSVFDLVTDCRALSFLYGKPNIKLPARLERWRLRLSPYMFTVVHKPAGRHGEGNPSDFLSRHPDVTADVTDRSSRAAEQYVNFVVNSSTPVALDIASIKRHTLDDPVLMRVINLIKTGKWHEVENDDQFKSLYAIRNELCVAADDGIVLRGQRILIPASLQQQVIQLAHVGHRGIVSTKKLLRSKVYFPNMDRLVENALTQCIACQAVTPTHQVEPLKMSPLPAAEWTELSADFAGPLPDGTYLLVIIDEYSRFPVVEIVRSTSARTVIPVVDRVMSLLGVCKTLKTDNGPPWNGSEWASFAKYLGFKHRRITPLWPSANSQAERFMSSLNRVLRTSQIEGKCWQQDLNAFLRAYRNTPHCTTQKAPSELLFHRAVRTTLPEITDISENLQTQDADLSLTDLNAKQKMKVYVDSRRHAKSKHLQVGDYVLVKLAKKDKLSPYYDPVPYIVTKIKGTMISASRNDHRITRNASFFKKIANPQTSRQGQQTRSAAEKNMQVSDDDDYSDDDVPQQHHANVPVVEQQSQQPLVVPARNLTPKLYPQRQSRRPPTRLNDFIVGSIARA